MRLYDVLRQSQSHIGLVGCMLPALALAPEHNRRSGYAACSARSRIVRATLHYKEYQELQPGHLQRQVPSPVSRVWAWRAKWIDFVVPCELVEVAGNHLRPRR